MNKIKCEKSKRRLDHQASIIYTRPAHRRSRTRGRLRSRCIPRTRAAATGSRRPEGIRARTRRDPLGSCVYRVSAPPRNHFRAADPAM